MEGQAGERSPALALRGTFVCSSLVEQGMERRLGRGTVHGVLLLVDDCAVMCCGSGAALFDLVSGEVLWEIDCPCSCGALTADGTTLALAAYRQISLWDLRTGRLLRRLLGHEGTVKRTAFGRDGRLLASGDGERVYVWETSTGDLRHVLSRPDARPILHFGLSPDSRLLAACGDGGVWLWDTDGGRLVKREDEESQRAGVTPLFTFAGISVWLPWSRSVPRFLVNEVAFSPDGRLLAVGLFEVELRDVRDLRLVRTLETVNGIANRLTFSTDGRLLACCDHEDVVSILDVKTGSALPPLHHGREFASLMMRDIAFSADGRLLALASGDEVVSVWEVESGRKHAEMDQHTEGVESIAFSPDGRLLVSAAFWDPVMRAWDAGSGKEARRWTPDHAAAASVFGSEGQFAVASHQIFGKTIQFWKAANGQDLLPLPLSTPDALW